MPAKLSNELEMNEETNMNGMDVTISSKRAKTKHTNNNNWNGNKNILQ